MGKKEKQKTKEKLKRRNTRDKADQLRKKATHTTASSLGDMAMIIKYRPYEESADFIKHASTPDLEFILTMTGTDVTASPGVRHVVEMLNYRSNSVRREG